MIKYYFVTPDGEVFINLPLSVSRLTVDCIARDLRSKQVYYRVKDTKIILDVS